MGRSSNQVKLLKRLLQLLELERTRPHRKIVSRPRQVQKRLNAPEQAELLQRYLAGERAYELAAAFDIHRATAARLLTDTGIRRPRGLTEDEIDDAVQLYGQGWSCQRIGERLRRDHGTMWLALKATGVEFRLPWSRS